MDQEPADAAGGLRYEHAWSWFPAGKRYSRAVAVLSEDARDAGYEGVTGYHDIMPRMGVAYDVFGNGKTSLKANVSKYLQPANNEGPFIIGNPMVRSWVRAVRQRRLGVGPTQRQLHSRLRTGGSGQQLELQRLGHRPGHLRAYTNANFANPFLPTRVNPAVLHGYGVRPYDWQWGAFGAAGVLPRVSVDVAFSRRSWGTSSSPTTWPLRPPTSTPCGTAPKNANLPWRRLSRSVHGA